MTKAELNRLEHKLRLIVWAYWEELQKESAGWARKNLTMDRVEISVQVGNEDNVVDICLTKRSDTYYTGTFYSLVALSHIPILAAELRHLLVSQGLTRPSDPKPIYVEGKRLKTSWTPPDWEKTPRMLPYQWKLVVEEPNGHQLASAYRRLRDPQWRHRKTIISELEGYYRSRLMENPKNPSEFDQDLLQAFRAVRDKYELGRRP